MATIQIMLEAQNDASRELLRLRGTVTQLNKVINEQRNSLVGATAEERKAIRAYIEANGVLKERIRIEMQEIQLRKSRAAQVAREAREEQQALNRLNRARERAVTELTAGFAYASRITREFTQTIVGASANMETYRATIQAVTGDTEATNQALEQLLGLTVELVGIDTGALIQYAARLMAAGLSAQEAIVVIRGITERVAEQGKSAATTNRVLEQYTQAINSAAISGGDFRPILRELPTLFRDASNAMGVQINSLEDLRDAAEGTGDVVGVLIGITEEMGRASQGADLSTLNAQLDILQDSAAVLAAELGEHLIPAIVAIIRQINSWIQDFQNLDDRAQAAIAWAIALTAGLTTLAGVIGSVTIAVGAFSQALLVLTGTAGLGGLASLATRAATAFGTLRTVIQGLLGPIGLVTTTLTTLGNTWRQIYQDFQRQRPFDDVQEQVTALNLSISKTAQGFKITSDLLSRASNDSANDILLLVNRMDELQNTIISLTNDAGNNQGALNNLREEYRSLSQQLSNLVDNVPELPTASENIEDLGDQLNQATNEATLLEQELNRLHSVQQAIIEARLELESLQTPTGETVRIQDITFQDIDVDVLRSAFESQIRLVQEFTNEILLIRMKTEQNLTEIVQSETDRRVEIREQALTRALALERRFNEAVFQIESINPSATRGSSTTIGSARQSASQFDSTEITNRLQAIEQAVKSFEQNNSNSLTSVAQSVNQNREIRLNLDLNIGGFSIGSIVNAIIREQGLGTILNLERRLQ